MKALSLCCALAAAALVLGSCAPDPKNTKVELSLYMARDVTAPDAGMWDEMVASFQKDHPNVTLVPEFLSGEPYHQKLKTMAVAGTLPDLVWLWPGKRTNYITNQGLVHDLRPSLKGEEANYAEITMTAAGKNNELYHLADGVVITTVMYTNNKLLKELGLKPAKTTDELIAQAKVIQAKGLVPVALSNRDAWEVQSCLVGTLLERFGGQQWYDDAVTNKAKFTDPAFVKAMALIKQLTDAKVFPAGINSMDYPESGEMFLQEKAVYYLDGSWKVNGLVTTLKPEQKEYISLEAFPDVPGQAGRSGSASAVAGPGFGINKKLEGAKFDAALAWVKHYSGEKGSMIRLQKGAIPAYKLNLEGAQLDPMVVKLADFIKTHPATNVLDDRMDGEGMGVLQPAIQLMMLGKKTPEAVAAEYEAWVAANDSSRK